MKKIICCSLLIFSFQVKSQDKVDTLNKEPKKTSSTNTTNTIWKDKTECEFNGWALNTVFNLPIIRYNVEDFSGKSDNTGSLEYFNSIGAGISLSYGRIHIKSKSSTDLTNSFDSDKDIEMKNVFGVSFGFLLSKSDSVGGNRMVFAPNANFQVLDFQLGCGYELGTVKNKAHRWILTLSYGIPLTKLSNVGSFLLSKAKNDHGEMVKAGFF